MPPGGAAGFLSPLPVSALEDEGIALRGLFIIDPQGTLRQITVNDLPVGRAVDDVERVADAGHHVVDLRGPVE